MDTKNICISMMEYYVDLNFSKILSFLIKSSFYHAVHSYVARIGGPHSMQMPIAKIGVNNERKRKEEEKWLVLELLWPMAGSLK